MLRHDCGLSETAHCPRHGVSQIPILFNILFYGLTVVLAVLTLPALLLPANAIRAMARLWGWMTVVTLRVAGGRHVLSGDMQADRQVIYAAKHQSA